MKTATHKILPLEGEIDLHLSPAVAESLNIVIKEKPRRLLVDLKDVSYIDSSGLAVLLDAMRNVEFYGGKFYLIGMQDGLRPVFETSRLDQVFRIYPDADSALTAT
jgi:anti-sigma B factor antagonist